MNSDGEVEVTNHSPKVLNKIRTININFKTWFLFFSIGHLSLRTPVLLNNSPIIRLSNIHEQCQD
ncbi:hypothetical protein NQ315_003847 [Exocentrus adspersus]|uniref:Uncharacterized protein n=1 Tax=Exocentrus adspersus TaxID=1586481 RepID=A0AAV8VYJ8_9CUCU|nr:hypothetical protein NQ315_003847 [Exocentrus adspersus]